MPEQEGVSKYQLIHHKCAIECPEQLKRMNGWRRLLIKLEMLGQIPERYQSLGFGNISVRHKDDSFVISGTQTGHLETLKTADLALVEQADPKKNRIKSSGLTAPSSEALTHAVLYQIDNTINAVIHVHCPFIWQQQQTINLPATAKNIPYGTTEMAEAVKLLYQTQSADSRRVFCMLGHQDGIIAFGKTLDHAAQALVQCYATALSDYD